jgi:hypothetical protein
MSAIPPKADIGPMCWNVRQVAGAVIDMINWLSYPSWPTAELFSRLGKHMADRGCDVTTKPFRTIFPSSSRGRVEHDQRSHPHERGELDTKEGEAHGNGRIGAGCEMCARLHDPVPTSQASRRLQISGRLSHCFSHRNKHQCYSITSSARALIDSGTESPSALAALRLIVMCILVTCCTGRLAGCSPLSTRPT